MLFEIGKQFPPDNHESRERLKRYHVMGELYDGKRTAWLNLRSFLDGEKRSWAAKSDGSPDLDAQYRIDDSRTNRIVEKRYRIINIFRFIVGKMAQLIFNKPVRLSRIADNPASNFAINRIMRSNRLQVVGKRIIKNLFINGDAFIKLRTGYRPGYAQDRIEVLLDVVDPSMVFPEFCQGTWDMDAVNIATTRSATDVEGRPVVFLAVERHSAGSIDYLAYRLDGREIVSEVFIDSLEWGLVWPDTPARQATGVDRILVWHVAADPYQCAFGDPPIYANLDLFDDLNKKMGGLAHMHDVCTSPRLQVPEAVCHHTESGQVEFTLQDIVPISPGLGSENLGWLEIQGQGPTMTLEYVRDLIDFICLVTSAPRALFKTTRDGDTGESGVAIEKKAVSTTLEAEDCINSIKMAFEEALYYAQLIEINQKLEIEIPPDKSTDSAESTSGVSYAPANYVAEWPEVTIQYGVVQDQASIVDTVVKKLQGELITREDAVLQANPNLNPESIEGYLAKIEENTSALPANQTRNRILDSLNANPETATGNELTQVAEEARGVGQ